MRIGFLVLAAHTMGGTERAVVTQAESLALLGHDAVIFSVLPADGAPAFPTSDRVRVIDLADRDAGARSARPDSMLRERPSRLVPNRWDRQFSAYTDVVLEQGLPGVDVDVLVTVTPALLAAAVQLAPGRVVVVHQEHRSTSQRTSGLEPLLACAPQADVVALLTEAMADWLRAELGPVAPPIVAVPNAVPPGYRPQSLLDSRTIVAAGRLVMEKQFTKLVAAFGEVADQLPGWRLRIFGTGHQRPHLVRETRKWGLWDRVELPGASHDLAGEWARASICALTSRAEGFPLNLQEAMAAGVPCVSFDCASGPREIVRHEVNGLLVAPESVAGMSAALLRVGTDDDLRHRLGAGALASSRRYEPEAIARRWVSIFADAVDRRAGRSRLAALAALAEPPPGRATRQPIDDAARRSDRGVTPAEARDLALAVVVDAARSATASWWVVPPHETDVPVVVVPMAARAAFLDALATAGAPAYLSLREPAQGGWPERRGPLATMARALSAESGRTSLLAVEPWPVDPDGSPGLLGQGCTVEIELWEEGPAGRLVAPRLNRWIQRLALDAPTVSAQVGSVPVRTLALMTAPTVHQVTAPVDVVITWVDGEDPAWNRARRARLAALTGLDTATAHTRAASGRARYLSRGELRYCLRSVHLFAPWARRIFLVTAGQVPDWFAPDHRGVTLVDHREILPPDALPTFNSHAIEAALHRIPDLGEQFVYLNDDFFLGRPLRPETFFAPAGLNAVFLSPSGIGPGPDPTEARDAADGGDGDVPPYLKAAWNNRSLLQDAFGAVITDNLAHAPYSLRRSVLAEIEQRFPDVVLATQHSPFRSDQDVSMASSLAPHYGLLTGTAVVAESTRSYINIANNDLEWQLRKTLRREQEFICLADHHDHALHAGRLQRTLTDFMATYFPVAAPWERSAETTKPAPGQHAWST